MILKPYYPKNIFKLPYYRGIYTGVFLGYGVLLLFSKYSVIGAVCLMVATLLYATNVRDD